MNKSKILLIVLVVLIGFVALWAMCTGTRTGCGVVERTMDPDNILANYEWFYDISQKVLAYEQNIKKHAQFLKDEISPKEKRVLRIELIGMEQICRELVQQYNANSQKLNRNLFKSNNLPYRLDMAVCEPGGMK